MREAARIVMDNLRAGTPVARFCWLSESDMGRSNSQLADEAMRLLGDVSLLMNLIYCAEPWSEREWRLCPEPTRWRTAGRVGWAFPPNDPSG